VWLKNYSDDIRIVKEGYTPQNYKDTGAKCISEYYARYQPFNDGKTLGLEQVITIDMDGYKLRGFIDRLSSAAMEYTRSMTTRLTVPSAAFAF